MECTGAEFTFTMPIFFKQLTDTRIEFVYVGATTDADMAASHERWLEVLERADATGGRFVLLADGTASGGMTAAQRRISAEFTAQHASLIARVCAAQAVVIVSAIQRGVLSAIVWLAPPPAPLRAFATRDAAERYLDEVEGNERRQTA